MRADPLSGDLLNLAEAQRCRRKNDHSNSHLFNSSVSVGVCSSSMTREKAGYRGPVRYVREERRSETGSSEHEWWFDPDGRLVAVAWTNPDGSGSRIDYKYDDDGYLLDPHRERKIIRNPDGSRREIDRVPVQANLAWGRIDGLQKTGGLGFGTRMASQVEVSYDPRGVPTEAVFTYDSGDIATRIEFRSDTAGNITEILQYGGSQPSFPLTAEQVEGLSDDDKEKFGAFLIPGGLDPDLLLV
jgi:hypothetical protein